MRRRTCRKVDMVARTASDEGGSAGDGILDCQLDERHCVPLYADWTDQYDIRGA